MFLFCLVFAMSLCASVYMCFVVTCWERIPDLCTLTYFQRSKSDNKAFLLIRLKKYLNPYENTCSKVISILIIGNILHESSSAPQQHKSVQYEWFALYFHRDVSHTDMLQPHFISCRGVSGAGDNMR